MATPGLSFPSVKNLLWQLRLQYNCHHLSEQNMTALGLSSPSIKAYCGNPACNIAATVNLRTWAHPVSPLLCCLVSVIRVATLINFNTNPNRFRISVHIFELGSLP